MEKKRGNMGRKKDTSDGGGLKKEHKERNGAETRREGGRMGKDKKDGRR